jgi:uncharacterized membrane protein
MAGPRSTAQSRADRIHAFQEELAHLQHEGLLVLAPDQQQHLAAHHGQLLQALAREFDVDTTAGQKQMSLGMGVVSFLGALALAASVFFFFYRIWGLISTPVQLLVLVSAPVLGVVAMEYLRTREHRPYFTSLVGLVAFAAFVLDLHLLGTTFNITPSQSAFLVWGAFGLLLAYTYELRLLLVAGLLCLLVFLSATAGTWHGTYWLSFGERPENFLPAGLLLFAIPALFSHRNYPDFPRYYRLFGMLTVLLAVLILCHWGRASYLRLSSDRVETLYQLLGFVVAAVTIWMGIRWKWSELSNLGSTFFVIDLYTKFYDWWWEWMPKYVFFLMLGLVAILLLLVFKRLRGQWQQEAAA